MVSRILVFEEKHCRRYFDASSEEATERAFGALLRERWKSGYWYYRFQDEEVRLPREVLEAESLTEEQVAALPDQLRGAQVRLRQRGASERRAKRLAKAKEDVWFSLAETFVNLPADAPAPIVPLALTYRGAGLPLASFLMAVRRDYEYEGYDFEKLEEV